MKKDLTEKQKRIYNFIKDTIRSKGYPPSVREICVATNLKSTSTVHVHLENLERKGYIRREAYKNRSIEVLDPTFYNTSIEIINVPVVGRVAAGGPIYAEENIEEFFPIPAAYTRGMDDIFMLRISGDSMIEAGIHNRDLVIVQKQRGAFDGDIVIALIEDTATCKRYFKKDGKIILKPENAAYEPIIEDNVEVIGKVVGLFRIL
ncbi:MAG: transcriptional repressor LexA [Clostridiales bacterium]|jgi:repressor LexA|nr:transcriptional repressor LexA [Clostridiales bacterium]